MDAIPAIEYFNNIRIMRRTLRDTMDPFDIPEIKFIEYYRMPPNFAIAFMEELQLQMGAVDSYKDIPFHLRFISALNFYGSGKYQRHIGMDAIALISQANILRLIIDVSKAICINMMPKYVQFRRDEDQINITKAGFLKKYKFPNVIGLIDATHIGLTGVSKEDRYAFVNRKGHASINTQIICDHNMLLLNVNARYPGSTHDSFVWGNSLAYTHMEKAYQRDATDWNTWLLGDSRYPLQPWLLTPFKTPSTNEERKYNKVHKRTRCLMKECISCLKGRFGCLLGERKLRCNHTDAGYIIYACATLHNYLINKGYDITQDIRMPVLPIVGSIDRRSGNDYLASGEIARNAALKLICK